MKYNPKIHHRRSIRLKGYDYSRAGVYFITICCQHMTCRFGRIIAGTGLAPVPDTLVPVPHTLPHVGHVFAPVPFKTRSVQKVNASKNAIMELNEFGSIAYNEWTKLPERFPNCELDVFQLMPNNMHGIIVLNETDVVTSVTTSAVRATRVVAPNAPNAPSQEAGASPSPATVGDIIGAYKSLVANAILDIFKSKNHIMGKFWQRNYYDIIIRDEQAYQNISKYIINNPANWKGDKFYFE